MQNEQEWITVAEAANLSGYSEQYLRRLVRTRRVQARKFGIVWQVHRPSLMDYVEQAQKTDDQRWGPNDS